MTGSTNAIEPAPLLRIEVEHRRLDRHEDSAD